MKKGEIFYLFISCLLIIRPFRYKQYLQLKTFFFNVIHAKYQDFFPDQILFGSLVDYLCPRLNSRGKVTLGGIFFGYIFA